MVINSWNRAQDIMSLEVLYIVMFIIIMINVRYVTIYDILQSAPLLMIWHIGNTLDTKTERHQKLSTKILIKKICEAAPLMLSVCACTCV